MQLPLPPAVIHRGLEFAADSFATTFMVGFVLVLPTFIPIAFLPRKREASQLAPARPATGASRRRVMIH